MRGNLIVSFFTTHNNFSVKDLTGEMKEKHFKERMELREREPYQ